MPEDDTWIVMMSDGRDLWIRADHVEISGELVLYYRSGELQAAVHLSVLVYTVEEDN